MQQTDALVDDILNQHSTPTPVARPLTPDPTSTPTPRQATNSSPTSWTIPRPSVQQIQHWCVGRTGITIVGTLLVFVLLVSMKPDYVCTQVDGQRTSDRNWIAISVITGITAFTIYMTPTIVGHVMSN